jgi:hypothetical protein
MKSWTPNQESIRGKHLFVNLIPMVKSPVCIPKWWHQIFTLYDKTLVLDVFTNSLINYNGIWSPLNAQANCDHTCFPCVTDGC